MLQEPFTWNWMVAFPYYKDLIKLLEGYCNTLCICTHAASKTYQEYGGKKLWQHNHQLHQYELIVIDNKWRLAKPRTLLIDDYTKNLEPFAAKGGDTLLFPQPWNAAHTNYQRPLAYVKEFFDFKQASLTS